jgi:hypothetical protein
MYDALAQLLSQFEIDLRGGERNLETGGEDRDHGNGSAASDHQVRRRRADAREYDPGAAGAAIAGYSSSPLA